MRPCLKLLDGATATNGVPANTAATGSIPATTGAQLTDLTQFVLDDGCGNPAVTFVFATAALSNASATRVRIAYTAGDTAATVQTAIIAAINGVTTALRITASDGGSSITTLTNDFGGTHGNITIGNTTAIAITGMSGGVQVGYPLNGAVPGTKYHWTLEDAGAFVLNSTAGSGAMTISVRIWVYSELTHAWGPLGISTTIASRGLLNDGTLITADPTGALAHREFVQGLSCFEAIYAEVTAAPGGVSTAVDLFLNSAAAQAAV